MLAFPKDAFSSEVHIKLWRSLHCETNTIITSLFFSIIFVVKSLTTLMQKKKKDHTFIRIKKCS